MKKKLNPTKDFKLIYFDVYMWLKFRDWHNNPLGIHICTEHWKIASHSWDN